MCCKIKTRSTIIGACNPKKNQMWDESLNMFENTGIMNSLLSRFDLIYVMIDHRDMEEESWKADACLYWNQKGFKMESYIWTLEKMRKYMGFIWEAFEPELSTEAEQIYCRYFNYIRACKKVDAEWKTARFLESMIWLG